jgi:alpha/beta superfamily hydrolase
MISGPAGALEARYHMAPFKVGAPTVLIAPPHPEHEGDMGHRVVFSLYRAFASLRFNVLRFNYRGCGRSEGSFTDGEEEISDVSACLDWLTAQNPSAPQCWVAGFSFGAWLSMQLLMRRPECHRFVSVAPPITLYDFSFLAPCPAPGLVIHGEDDDVSPQDAVKRFIYQLSLQNQNSAHRKGHKIDLHSIEGADHHFSKHSSEVEKVVCQYVKSVEMGGSSSYGEL